MANRPIMIAVGGDSGTGKTTLTRGIHKIFGTERIQMIGLADYHSLDRAQRKLVNLTALDPRASNFAAMEEDLWALRDGRTIDKPVYDHRDGTFKGHVRVEPKEIVIVHGLFPLYTRALRSLFDVRVWLEPDAEMTAAWKVQRDTTERGYDIAEARAEMQRRQPDIDAYINPQARYADLTVSFFHPKNWLEHKDPSKYSTRIRKGGRFRALDYGEFASASTSLSQTDVTSEGGYPETLIELDGNIDRETAEALEERLWSKIASHGQPRPSGIGEFVDENGMTKISYSLSLAQLLIARRVALVESERMEAV